MLLNKSPKIDYLGLLLYNILMFDFPSLFVSFILAFSATCFWLYFWYYFSKKYTTPRKFLLKALIFGIIGAFVIAILEKTILTDFFPASIVSIIQQQRNFRDVKEALYVFGVVLFLTAFPEEILKFLIFRFSVFKSDKFNQIIDAIKFGLVLGLGFALVENTYFFFEQTTIIQSSQNTVILFILRFFITTLAHSLYGGIMGYYFGLSKFYKIFKSIFLWQGFISVVLLHTFFNFLVLSQLNIFNIVILIFILILLMKWYTDRSNFQMAISKKASKIKTPIFSEQREIQALIAEGTKSDFHAVDKMGLCPFCFKKIEGKVCSYCGHN